MSFGWTRNNLKNCGIIAVEGIDGVGKSTLVKNIANELQGYHFSSMFSQWSKIKPYVDEYGYSEARLAFFTGSLIDSAYRAKRLIHDGIIVVDRWLPSSIAYHSVRESIPWRKVLSSFQKVNKKTLFDVCLMVLIQADPDTIRSRISSRVILSSVDRWVINEKENTILLMDTLREVTSNLYPKTIIVDSSKLNINQLSEKICLEYRKVLKRCEKRVYNHCELKISGRSAMNIPFISSERLKTGEYRSILPELYELNKIVENNEWHRNENAFLHTVEVVDYCEKIIDRVGHFVSEPKGKIIENRMSSTISNDPVSLTRMQLLLWAALLHDIGKKDTFKINSNGETSCKGHEKQSASKIKIIGARLGIIDVDTKIIEQIVELHTEPILIYSKAGDKDPKILYKEISENLPKAINVELCLITMADQWSSELRRKNSTEYEKIEKTMIEIIDLMLN